MKGFGFLFMFWLIGTADFMHLGCSSKGSTASSPGSRNGTAFTVQGRKLKVDIDPTSKDENDAGFVQLEDYRPIDPVPSSTGSIRPGPIEHDAPLMPYIPEPSPPPSQLQQGGLP
ncbi:uncharacterized protein LOC105159115 [Sesamum indicum]|uniref:Uncharacterized protein LOC105159115 n=1 Tax=Sesamum indicum TaxID=4182 RepID=A0A8M8UMI3_SESIN|nr:uncharacterized protein LOC105159115 [Sesamum indicum]